MRQAARTWNFQAVVAKMPCKIKDKYHDKNDKNFIDFFLSGYLRRGFFVWRLNRISLKPPWFLTNQWCKAERSKSISRMRIFFCCRFDGKAYCTDVTDSSWKQGLPQNQVVIRMKEKCHAISTWKNVKKRNVSFRVEMGSLCWSKDIYRRHAHCFAVCTRVGILRLRIQLSCSWRRDRKNPFPKQASLCSKPHHSLCISKHRFFETNTRVPGLHAPSAVGNLLMNLSKSAMIVVASWPSTTSSLRQSSPKLLSLKPHGFEHYFWI